MCGIAGIVGPALPEATQKMVAAMRHRGPDDSGFFCDPFISLGMARLAIIDVKSTGHQPMSNPERSVWIIYNGETYNFLEQRAYLEKLGYQFHSTSDTEVILRLYEHFGDDFLQHMSGMFALAIYDKRKGPGREKLLLARDPLGIKPLLYAEVNGQLVFASEIKAILASGLLEREIEPVALRLLLTHGSVYQPLSILRGVKMLMPAHRMIIENGRRRLERYWSLARDRMPELRTLPYQEQVQAMSEALSDSVRRQLISDVPLGAFLSGGVDSSILVALMAQEVGPRLNTFSVGFESEGTDIDESQAAATVARFLGTNHNHVLVRATDVRQQILDIATALDQPSIDGVNMYFASQAAHPGITVAISGTGSDELFAGYPWFQNLSKEQARPDSFQSHVLAEAARQPMFDRLLQTRFRNSIVHARTRAGFLNRFALQYRIFGSAGAAAMISPSLRRDAHAGRAEFYDIKPGDELGNDSILNRVTGLCLNGYTRNQLLRDTDAVSMAHTLEVRVPYLDLNIVNMALSLPDESKHDPAPPPGIPGSYRASGIKRVLLDAARPLLPKNFDLRCKRGFAMPFNNWLNGSLKEVLLETLSATSIRKRGWLDTEAVSNTLDEFLAGHSDWTRPWLLMMLELWARQVLDRRTEA